MPFSKLVLNVYKCFPCIYVCVSHVCSVHTGEKITADPLGLELEMIVSPMCVLGTEPRSSMITEQQTFLLLIHFSILHYIFFIPIDSVHP